MAVEYAILISLAACALAAGLEGLLAGRNVKPYLAELQHPSFSPSLLVWSIIGGGYYIICFTLLYRLFRHEGSSFPMVALALLLIVMALNALWNFTFFRMKDLRLSFFLSLIYGVIALALFGCLVAVDRIAALVLLAYIIYMVYSYRWGYQLLKLNP